ncbi:MAG: NAD(P)H-binding protein [Nitrospirae bacterium]|nr:NAD(P)H-binding protein [Nitrospirota bacterium]
MGDARPFTLALFGGSGATGRAIIDQAVQGRIRIRGLVREGSSLGGYDGEVIRIKGSLSDAQAIAQTLEGADAVSIVIGPRPPYRDVFCATATGLILEAMRRHGITRVVCQTGAMIGDYPANQSSLLKRMAKLFQRQRPAISRDRVEQERLIRTSGLEWTLIKPPRLTNGPRSKRFKSGDDLKAGLLSSVSRADVAAFTLDEVLSPRHIREAVFMAG